MSAITSTWRQLVTLLFLLLLLLIYCHSKSLSFPFAQRARKLAAVSHICEFKWKILHCTALCTCSECNDKPVATVGDPALSCAFASARVAWKTRFSEEIPRANRYLDSHMLSWLRNPLTMSSSLCSLDSSSRERYVFMLLKRRCEFHQGFQIILSMI